MPIFLSWRHDTSPVYGPVSQNTSSAPTLTFFSIRASGTRNGNGAAITTSTPRTRRVAASACAARRSASSSESGLDFQFAIIIFLFIKTGAIIFLFFLKTPPHAPARSPIFQCPCRYQIRPISRSLARFPYANDNGRSRAMFPWGQYAEKNYNRDYSIP